MRLIPALILLSVILAVACSSSNTTKSPVAATVPAAAATTVATSVPVGVAPTGTAPTATRMPPSGRGATPIAAATSAPKDETGLAKQLLLQLADFPAGYTEKPGTAQSGPLDKLCMVPKSAGETGKAETGDFTANDGNTSVFEGLALFDSPEHADAAFSTGITAGDCIVKAITAGKLDDDKAAYSQATFSPVSFPRFGDRSNAYRLQIHAKVKGQTGLGSEADAFFDLVYVRDGRVAYAIETDNILTPFDSTLLRQVVSKADAAARRGLGLPASTPAPQ